jgi:hypothetical protein
MLTEKISLLARQTANDDRLSKFALDPEVLAAAISKAVDEHELLFRQFASHEAAADTIRSYRRVAAKVRAAATAWDSLPAQHKGHMLDFVGTKSDDVSDRLHFVLDLIEEFGVHYGRKVGNPGRSRDEHEFDQRPLEGFVAVLMDYWMAETGTAPGHKVDSSDPRTGEQREPLSPFMVLVSAAATELHVSPYDTGHFETVARNLKR